MQRLKQIMFKFQNDERPYSLAARVAGSLQRHPPAEVLAGGILFYEPDPAATADIIARLSLDAVRVTHQAKALADRCCDKDTSYDSPMKFETVPSEWLAAWKDALNAELLADDVTTAASALGLHLPTPNPFVPEDLSLKEPPAVPVPLPTKLRDTVSPVKVFFHRQDETFKQPKVVIYFFVRSPNINETVQNSVKTNLWCRILEEALAEYAYDAEIAGVQYSLGLSAGGLSLVFSGFHDKLGVLIKAVTTKMKALTPLPENLYQIAADAYGDQLRNALFHSRPISQCAMRCDDLLSKGASFPIADKYNAFQQLKREDLDGVCKEVFTTCHVEAMALGNCTPEDARALSAIFTGSLGLDRALEVLPTQAEARLPLGATVWNLDSSDKDDPNHAVLMRLQLRKGIETETSLLVLSKVLSAKFFDVLRTQQQLGYIVGMGASMGMSFDYLVAQVQTEYAPNYTRSRIDAFLHEHFAWVEEGLEEEEFQTCVRGVLAELKTKPKNLSEEFSRYSREFTHRSYDFGHRDSLIAHLEKGMCLADLRTYVRDCVKTAPRLYVQVKKVLEKEDKALPDGAEVPEDPPTLRTWSGYEATVREFTSTCEWFPIKSVIE
jgi:insulysin